MRVTRPLSACTISLQAFLFFVIICVLRSALSTCQHITIFWYGIHSHCVAIIVIILSWTGTHSVAVADALARAVPTLLLLVINDNAQRENNFTAWSTWAGIQLLRPGRKLRNIWPILRDRVIQLSIGVYLFAWQRRYLFRETMRWAICVVSNVHDSPKTDKPHRCPQSLNGYSNISGSRNKYKACGAHSDSWHFQ